MKKIRKQVITNETKILIPLLLLSLALVFTFCVSDVSAASGDTIYVNGSGGNDSWDGQSATWISGTTNGPKLSIKNATGTVNANGTINIADGIYTGVNNTGITIDKNMTIIGQSQTGTIINGENTNWIFIIASGVNVTFQNLTLANGTANFGGAIYNRGTCNVAGCTFTGNTASLQGGAICNTGTCNVVGCAFTGNTAVYQGGAISNWGGTCTVHFNRIVENTASQGNDIYNLGSNFNADYNWWGSNAGPSAGRVVGANVNSWLVLTVTASPTTINNGETSTITADLQHDNLGNYYDPITNGHVPDGILVDFSFSGTPLGTLNTNQVYTNNGAAANTFTANAVGTSHVMAAVDSYTVGPANINIPHTSTTITVDLKSGYKGDSVDLTATLMDTVHKVPIDGKNISFYVNDVLVGSGTTDANGVAAYTYNILQNVGYYTILAEFAQDDVYAASNNTGNLTINGTPTNLAVDNVTGNKGKSINLKATLWDTAHDKAIAGKIVDFYLNGVKIGSAITDANGVATLLYDIGLVGGTYDIDAEFTADNIYVGSTGEGTLKVTKSSVYVLTTVSKNNPNVGETITLTFKLGNKGPDSSEDVVFTYVIPEGMEFVSIESESGYPKPVYDPATRTITWNLGTVPILDPWLKVNLKVLKSSSFNINPTVTTSTYDPALGTSVQTTTVNAVNTVSAASKTTKTIPLQRTGLPLTGLLLAVMAVLGGLSMSKWKN